MFMLVIGPGLVVMLADTDAGSVITAAQSGARWGYKLLLLQALLIPILYMVQELTVRLGLVTGRGHGELIRERFGRGWAWLSVSTLVVACLGALVSELSGMAGVGLLYGVPTWLTMLLTIALILTVVWTGSYRSVERIAILLGIFELAFLWVAWRAHP
ncbi:MAG TPA: divalent metal cation transporter, partial [Gammaproteobacteria bacterium]|nr:divalent metal cation transporter [Gammaproteobacteria bacterium]